MSFGGGCKNRIVFLKITGYNEIRIGGDCYGCVEKRGNVYNR